MVILYNHICKSIITKLTQETQIQPGSSILLLRKMLSLSMLTCNLMMSLTVLTLGGGLRAFDTDITRNLLYIFLSLDYTWMTREQDLVWCAGSAESLLDSLVQSIENG